MDELNKLRSSQQTLLCFSKGIHKQERQRAIYQRRFSHVCIMYVSCVYHGAPTKGAKKNNFPHL